jgi:hypothetical protein
VTESEQKLKTIGALFINLANGGYGTAILQDLRRGQRTTRGNRAGP